MSVSISLVVPVYAGEAYLVALVDQIEGVMNEMTSLGTPFRIAEAIFVDDASIDSSSSILKKIAENREWLKVLTMSRNYGQHAATAAGICHSHGDWVVTLDEDLQHSPADIIPLFESQAIHQADVVYAASSSGSHGGWRDWASRTVKRTIASLTKTPQIVFFSSFRLIRGDIARTAASSSSSQTYLDMALTWYTTRVVKRELVLTDTRYKGSGESGYKLVTLVSHGRKLIRSSGLDVSLFGFCVGGITLLLAVVFSVLAIFTKLVTPEEIALVGWTSLFTAVLFVGGIIILLICIILEYVSLMSANVLGRPTFFSINRDDDYLISDWFEEK